VFRPFSLNNEIGHQAGHGLSFSHTIENLTRDTEKTIAFT